MDHWGFGVWVLPLALSAALCLAAAERLAPPSASPKHHPVVGLGVTCTHSGEEPTWSAWCEQRTSQARVSLSENP